MACEEAKRDWIKAERAMLKVRDAVMVNPQATAAEMEELSKVNERYAEVGRAAIKAMTLALGTH